MASNKKWSDFISQGETAENSYTNERNSDEEKDGAGALKQEESRGTGTTKTDPFGDESNAEVKYKTMEWWQAGMLMIAETISLGILSLPSVLATVGMVA